VCGRADVIRAAPFTRTRAQGCIARFDLRRPCTDDARATRVGTFHCSVRRLTAAGWVSATACSAVSARPQTSRRSSHSREPFHECLSQRGEPSGEHRSRQGDQRSEARVEAAGDKHDQRLSERLDPQAHPQTHAALSNDSRRGRLDAGRCIRDLRTNADPTDHPCSC